MANDIIQFFNPNGFWSERFLFRISETRPFGIQTFRSGVARAFPGEPPTRKTKMRKKIKKIWWKNERTYRKMRKDWGNVLILPTREWEAGYGPDRSDQKPFGIRPFGIKTFCIKNRSEQWHFGIKIFGEMTLRIISLSDQRTKYSSEKRPFGIKTIRNKTIRNKNRSEKWDVGISNCPSKRLYVFEQLLGLWLDLLVEQFLNGSQLAKLKG